MCKFCDTQGKGNLCDNEIFEINIDLGVLGDQRLNGTIWCGEDGTEVLNIGFVDAVFKDKDKVLDHEIKINYCPMCGRELKGAKVNV